MPSKTMNKKKENRTRVGTRELSYIKARPTKIGMTDKDQYIIRIATSGCQ